MISSMMLWPIIANELSNLFHDSGFINPKFALEGDKEKYESEIMRDLGSQYVSASDGDGEMEKGSAHEDEADKESEVSTDDIVNSVDTELEDATIITEDPKNMPLEYRQLIDTEWAPNPLFPDLKIHHHQVFSKVHRNSKSIESCFS